MRQISVRLTPKERQRVRAFRSKGVQPSAREVNRAHILAALDQGISDEQISQVLGIERTVIWRTRSAYQEKGLEYALHDVARSGAPRKYAVQTQAEVSALACSDPPSGAKRWTLPLLVEALRQRPGLAEINRESVRQMLKKTSFNPGAS